MEKKIVFFSRNKMSYWDALPREVQRMIFRMDPTYRDVYQKSVQCIAVLRTHHIMKHYCRVFFEKDKTIIPCEVKPYSFHIYSFSKRRMYGVMYTESEHDKSRVDIQRWDVRSGSVEHQILLYRSDVGFGRLRHPTDSPRRGEQKIC